MYGACSVTAGAFHLKTTVSRNGDVGRYTTVWEIDAHTSRGRWEEWKTQSAPYSHSIELGAFQTHEQITENRQALATEQGAAMVFASSNNDAHSNHQALKGAELTGHVRHLRMKSHEQVNSPPIKHIVSIVYGVEDYERIKKNDSTEHVQQGHTHLELTEYAKVRDTPSVPASVALLMQ
jgi:hypothetical protein